jgi:aminopeptidase N
VTVGRVSEKYFALGLVLFVITACQAATAQEEQREQRFTRADTLRGMLSPLRSCYDVRFYHLDVRIDPARQFIEGSNTITFTALVPFDRMQIDLFDTMAIRKVTLDGTLPVTFTREFNAVFLEMPKTLAEGSTHRVQVFYSGNPIVAKMPPWEGGFTWTRDSSGNPWVVVTCQGTGASLWWPNKDHQSDKPDSMLISIAVPQGLMDISNGRLRGRADLPDGWVRYDWFVSYPINNYNVTVNIGKYAHFSDLYAARDTVTLDYYVMPENLEKARVHFRQVKSMFAAFERYFGTYPFPRDGYKLIECPHTGMEHQSAVAYGNLYLEGYRGRASSEVGLKFDFIIVHESAHEWWGNSVTAKDVADMWIHESFGAYAEALYVEHMFGYQEAVRYINGKKQGVRNSTPIIGTYNVQHEGSGDMYDKGQLVLHTLRNVIGNDSLWFSLLRGLQERFRYSTVTAEDVMRYVNETSGSDYTYFFDQYLRYAKLPQLEVFLSRKEKELTARYRWRADVKDFRMPVSVTSARNTFTRIVPTTSWQTLQLDPGMRPEDFAVDSDMFYVTLRLNWVYLDPNLKDYEFH